MKHIALFLAALSLSGPVVARTGLREASGTTLEAQAGALVAAGRVHEAGDIYMSAGKAYTAEGNDTAAARAFSEGADCFEKDADALSGQANAPTVTQPVPPTRLPAHARPLPKPAPHAPLPTRANPDTRIARLPPLSPRPHYIIGRVIFEDGRPVPNFVVKATGFNGKFDVLLNVSETATSFGEAKGSNGVYAMQVAARPMTSQGKLDYNEDALICSVTARTTLHYNGTTYGIELHPLDGVQNGTGSHDFRGQMRRGVVRDFVMKMTGIKPGFKAVEYPDHGVDRAGSNSRGAYYGGGLSIDCSNGTTPNDVVGRTSVLKAFPKGSTITLTLNPTQALLDGSPGRTITRSATVGYETDIYSIPYGVYTATAILTEPGGTTHNLRWKATGYDPASPFLDTMPVHWTPLVTSFDPSGETIGNAQLYLMQ